MRNAFAIAAGLFLFLSGCGHGQVVRDADVYRAELDQYDRWAARQATLLRDFVSSECRRGQPLRDAPLRLGGRLALDRRGSPRLKRADGLLQRRPRGLPATGGSTFDPSQHLLAPTRAHGGGDTMNLDALLKVLVAVLGQRAVDELAAKLDEPAAEAGEPWKRADLAPVADAVEQQRLA
jgi:hypothetical protein